MIDLTRAINCINVMKEYGTYRNYKIGIIKDKIEGITNYEKGEVVLFSEDLTPTNSELCMGEYMGMKQKKTGTITLESPLPPEWIQKNKEKKSLITTIRTIIKVPKKYVEEVKIE